MGVKSRKKKAAAAQVEATTLAEAPPAPAEAPVPAELPRDAGRLALGDMPERVIDPPAPGRENRFQVVFREAALDDIRAHGAATPDVEVCGVLVGNIYRDDAGPYCQVEANIRGNYAAGRNAQVTFTSETWTHIHETMDASYPDQRIVGWYHTHPGFGIFLSEMDLFIQSNFFSEAWQIAFVDDPKGGDRGAFVWRNGQSVREPFLVQEDLKITAAPSNDSQPRSDLVPLEYSARIRLLERELARQQVRTRWLAVAAAIWPILLLAAAIESGLVSGGELHRQLHQHWSPAPATRPTSRPVPSAT